MDDAKPRQKVYWFASRTRFLNSGWFRWYPVTVQGLVAWIALLAGYLGSITLFFTTPDRTGIFGAIGLFILTQVFAAFLLFRKTRAIDIDG